MNRALVIGASGYLGRHLVQALRQEAEGSVFGLSRSRVNADGWCAIQADIVTDELAPVFAEIQPDWVFLAAGVGRDHPVAHQHQVNVLGTQRVLKALATACPQARSVVIGSAAEYGLSNTPVDEQTAPAPLGDYGRVKALQTETALQLGHDLAIPVIVARVFNVYGASPKHLVIASLASQIAALTAPPTADPQAERLTIRMQNIESRRDFVHLDDVVKALLLLAANGQPGQLYNVASGEAVSIRQVLGLLLDLAEITGWPVEATGPQTPDCSQADIRRMGLELGWQPRVALADGLARELAYWQSQRARPVVV